MMMLEFEGKALLGSAGLPVPAGLVLARGDETARIFEETNLSFPVALKAQVRSGGRGKAGGVLRADTADDARAYARRLFGQSFGGEIPEAILIEPWQQISRELYLSVTVDGSAGGYVVLYAPEGGIHIEEGRRPARYAFGPPSEFRAHKLRAVIAEVESDPKITEQVVALGERLLRLAVGRDCTTIEVNPLAVLANDSIAVLDAKVVRDEWASFRQQDIDVARTMERRRQTDLVRACLEMNHMYVPLEGDVALISGGAGMTMGAMDMVQDHGGRPACFLDCSPGPASTRGYKPAFAMLDADDRVKVILVSIFGGGTHMDRVANAMRDILSERTSRKPVVFRLDGTHVDQVDGILADVGARNHPTLESAVREAVELARSAA